MVYLSFEFMVFTIISIILYYLIPCRFRWIVMLLASGFFYLTNGISGFLVMAAAGILSWLIGKMAVRKKKFFLFLGVVLALTPLVTIKINQFYTLFHEMIVPLGVSFYSLQLVSYIVDLYKGEVEEEKNPFRFFLYVLWFPQIVQGPITRYKKGKEILCGHLFEEENITRGFQLVLWGLFLKFMIADKAGVIVNAIYGDSKSFGGIYVLIAGILYSVQLYTDFMSCVKISQGISWLFGVEIIENFNRPYFAESIGDFWRRWHMSLSSWLRDYVYIPLGGNRKGNFRKYLNLMITFLVSGFWHGNGVRFLFWGFLHGIYQIVEKFDLRSHLNKNDSKDDNLIYNNSFVARFLRILRTDILVMLAWIIFRAGSLRQGIKMLISIVKDFNPWIIGNKSLFTLLGVELYQVNLLFLMMLVLLVIEVLQEYKKVDFVEFLMKQSTFVRWFVYLAVILLIWTMGTYGSAYNANAFIYGGF